MKTVKRLRILHSNDLHADLCGDKEQVAKKLFSLHKTITDYRTDETLYLIAGDMLNGNIIDATTKGFSTIQVVNYLNPDVVALGNHDFEYGTSWMLLLEKVANFSTICANVYIKNTNKRVFKPYEVLEINGMKILIIGVTTLSTLKMVKENNEIDYIEIKDPVDEVKDILKSFLKVDIDLTICLTHLGIQEDIQLAQSLDKSFSVDLIIGGHSHSHLSEAKKENGIYIVQAGSGSDYLGILDLEIDTFSNTISKCDWRLVSNDSYTYDPKSDIYKIFESYHHILQSKYNNIVTILPKELSHSRDNYNGETEINIFLVERFNKYTNSDVSIINSGITRVDQIGKVITVADIYSAWTFNGSLYQIEIKGSSLEQVFSKIGTKNKAYFNHVDLEYDKIYKVLIFDFHLSRNNFWGMEQEIISKKIVTDNFSLFMVEMLSQI